MRSTFIRSTLLLMAVVLISGTAWGALAPTIYWDRLDDSTIYIKQGQYTYVAVISATDTTLYGPNGMVLPSGTVKLAYALDTLLIGSDSGIARATIVFEDSLGHTIIKRDSVGGYLALLLSSDAGVTWDTLYANSAGGGTFDTSRVLITDRPDTAVGPIVVTGGGLSELDSLLTKQLFIGVNHADSLAATKQFVRDSGSGGGSVDSSGIGIGAAAYWSPANPWLLRAAFGLDFARGDSAGVDTIRLVVDTSEISTKGHAEAYGDSAVANHAGAADPHAGYRLESADIDPDQTTNDATDNDIIDSVLAAQRATTLLGDLDPDQLTGDATDNNLPDTVVAAQRATTAKNADRADTLGRDSMIVYTQGDTGWFQSGVNRWKLWPSVGERPNIAMYSNDSLVATITAKAIGNASYGDNSLVITNGVFGGYMALDATRLKANIFKPALDIETSAIYSSDGDPAGADQIDMQDTTNFPFRVNFDTTVYIGGVPISKTFLDSLYGGDIIADSAIGADRADTLGATVGRANAFYTGDTLLTSTARRFYIKDTGAIAPYVGLYRNDSLLSWWTYANTGTYKWATIIGSQTKPGSSTSGFIVIDSLGRTTSPEFIATNSFHGSMFRAVDGASVQLMTFDDSAKFTCPAEFDDTALFDSTIYIGGVAVSKALIDSLRDGSLENDSLAAVRVDIRDTANAMGLATTANIHDSLIADTNVFLTSFNRLKDTAAAVRADIRDTANVIGYELYADSGTYQEVPKSVVNTKIVVGNASDTATADSTVATIGKAKDLIGDSLASLSVNQQFVGDVWTYGISAEANKSFDLSLPYMYLPLPDTIAKIPLPAHYMRKIGADSAKFRYVQVHPAVAHIPWGDDMGWTYHVLSTPYAGASAAYENICYYVSNDMVNFYQYIDTAGDTVHNPIYSGIADTLYADSTWDDGQSKLRQLTMKPTYLGWDTAQYTSDPHIMWDALGKKWIGFRGSFIYAGAPDTFCLYVVHFDSMLNKRPPTMVLKSAGSDDGGGFGSADSLDGWALSPSWWLDDTATVKMLFIDQDSAAGPDGDENNDWILASAPDYDYGESGTTHIVNIDSVQVDSVHSHVVDSCAWIVTQGAQACTLKFDGDAVSASIVTTNLVALINSSLDSCRAVKLGSPTAATAKYVVKAFNGSSNVVYSAAQTVLGDWETWVTTKHANKKEWNDTATFYDATTGWTMLDTIHPTVDFWHASFKRVAPRQILGMGCLEPAYTLTKIVQSFDAGATWTYPTDTIVALGKSKYLNVTKTYRSDFWVREGGRLGVLLGMWMSDTTRLGVTYSQIVPFDTLQRVVCVANGPYLTPAPSAGLVIQSTPKFNQAAPGVVWYQDSVANLSSGTAYTDTTDWIFQCDDDMNLDSIVIPFKTHASTGSNANYITGCQLFGGGNLQPSTLRYNRTADTSNANWTRFAYAISPDTIYGAAGTFFRLKILAVIVGSANSGYIKYQSPPMLIGHKKYWRDPNVPR